MGSAPCSSCVEGSGRAGSPYDPLITIRLATPRVRDRGAARFDDRQRGQGAHDVMHGRKISPVCVTKTGRASADLMTLDGLVWIGVGRERDLARLRRAPVSSARCVFQYQRPVRRSHRFVDRGVVQVRDFELEKAKPIHSAVQSWAPSHKRGSAISA